MSKRLAAVAITAASILPIGEAKAASTWDAYAGQRACMYLRQGATPQDAGYKAALDLFNTRWQSAVLRASNQYLSYIRTLSLVLPPIHLSPPCARYPFRRPRLLQPVAFCPSHIGRSGVRSHGQKPLPLHS